VRLATLRDGTRDGALVVVAPDGTRCARATAVAPALHDSRYIASSAMMCLSDWNDPIGRPNATRSLAYCTVIVKSASIAPTVSATLSAMAICS